MSGDLDDMFGLGVDNRFDNEVPVEQVCLKDVEYRVGELRLHDDVLAKVHQLPKDRRVVVGGARGAARRRKVDEPVVVNLAEEAGANEDIPAAQTGRGGAEEVCEAFLAASIVRVAAVDILAELVDADDLEADALAGAGVEAFAEVLELSEVRRRPVRSLQHAHACVWGEAEPSSHEFANETAARVLGPGGVQLQT